MNCPKCLRSFKTQGALNGHQRAHTFHAFLSKQPDQEARQEARDTLNAKIVVAAIHHYSQQHCRPAARLLGAAPHCDVCAVVREVDRVLLRDLADWLKSEGQSKP